MTTRTGAILAASAAAVLAGLAAGAAWAEAPATLSGAGASFPAPVYQAWSGDYQAAKGVKVGYESIGSGGGVKQIEAAAVDFGATDKPLAPEELDKQNLIQFPTVLGGVVPVIHVPGLHSGQLHLDGPLLADIFAAKVSMWNDPRIQAMNPGLTLPELPITLVVRADKSGTTFMWTSYLSAVSPDFKAKVGAGDEVKWVWGVRGVGNAGVSTIMSETLDNIGYVEYAYAKQHNLDIVVMKNRDGAFVEPNEASFSAAAAKADWTHARGFAVSLVDQPGAGAWPITGATYLLVRKDASVATRRSVLDFVGWAYDAGDAKAVQLDYVPLPAEVKALVRQSWTVEGAR